MFVQRAGEGAGKGIKRSIYHFENRQWVLCFVLFVCVLSLKNGYAPVEFFLEGTRSRSAKTLTPKFGRSLTEGRKNINPKALGVMSSKLLIELDTFFCKTLSFLYKCNYLTVYIYGLSI